MSLIISFLVVSKLQLAFYRYMEARSLLGQAFTACRDIHQHAVVFTQRLPDHESFREDVRGNKRLDLFVYRLGVYMICFTLTTFFSKLL
jgi:predicted membrane chloride channel (bestrophin family)